MVEYTYPLDSIFSALADPTRRDILQRVSQVEMTVSEIAQHYSLTLAAVSKHLKVLENAKLIVKRRQGKEQHVQTAPAALASAADYLDFYRKLWDQRLDSLENYLMESEG
jgi:DNA-binding transcriptional ArsR family regulator